MCWLLALWHHRACSRCDITEPVPPDLRRLSPTYHRDALPSLTWAVGFARSEARRAWASWPSVSTCSHVRASRSETLLVLLGAETLGEVSDSCRARYGGSKANIFSSGEWCGVVCGCWMVLCCGISPCRPEMAVLVRNFWGKGKRKRKMRSKRKVQEAVHCLANSASRLGGKGCRQVNGMWVERVRRHSISDVSSYLSLRAKSNVEWSSRMQVDKLRLTSERTHMGQIVAE